MIVRAQDLSLSSLLFCGLGVSLWADWSCDCTSGLPLGKIPGTWCGHVHWWRLPSMCRGRGLSPTRVDNERRPRLDPVPRWALFSKGHETESWKLGRNPSSLFPAPLTDNRINLGILWNLSLNVIKGHMLECQQNPNPCLYPEEGPERCCWPITYFQ